MTQTTIERRFSKIAAATNQKCRRLGIAEEIRGTDLARVFLRSGWRCTYCSIGIDPMHCSFDHVVPFERGGQNIEANIVACCMSCQRSKGIRSVKEFGEARALGRQPCVVCGTEFTPRWADWKRGYGRTCSLVCAGKLGGRPTKGNPASLTPEGAGVTG